MRRGTPTPPVADEPTLLDHERLDCFRVALEFAAIVPALTQTSRAALRDQLERAAASICLNLAEGCGRRARPDRLHFFAMAQGSAMECAASQGLPPVPIRQSATEYVTGQVTHADATRPKHKLARIVQMLIGLRRAASRS